MLRTLSLCAMAIVLGAAPALAGTEPNLEAVSISPGPAAVAGSMLNIEVIARVDPGLNVTFTPYLTTRGVLQGAIALAPVILPQPAIGRTVRAEMQIAIPSDVSGIFTVAMVLDAVNMLSELNELDNTAVATSLTRIRAQGADPIVTMVSAQQDRRRPQDPLTVDVTLRNSGELAATVELGAYLSTDSEISPLDPEVGLTTVTVAGGAEVSTTISGPVPAQLSAGIYQLGIIVDPSGAVPEIFETNNIVVASRPLTVYFDTLTLDTTDLPGATLTQLFHVVLQSTGGDGRHQYRVTQGVLPDGLTLQEAGVLSGTPIRSGDFDFSIEVSSDGKSAERDYSVTVERTNAILTIATRDATEGFLSMPYEQLLLAGGGEGPYSWDLVSGGGVLPPGLDLTPAGLLTGIPNTLGVFHFTVQVDDFLGNRDQGELAIEVTSATNVIILTQGLDPLPVGEPADIAIVATGGVQPYAWVGLSPPPPGLAFTEEGHLVGTPVSVGRWPFWVRATDGSRGRIQDSTLVQVEVVDAGAFDIDVPVLPNARTRTAYELIITASGGQPPLKWSVTTGSSLPDDFFLVQGDGTDAPDNTALLYGFPIFDGVYPFTVRVEDAYGRRREMSYALTVDPVFVDIASGCRCVSGANNSAWLGLGLVALGLLSRRRRGLRG